MVANADTHRALYQNIGLAAGPLLGMLIVSALKNTALPTEAISMAGIATWMAIWWATEAIPVAVTAFLPLVVFPLFGIGTFKVTATSYAHPIIYLFLGGFVVALAIERSGLHIRAALNIFRLAGMNGKSLVAGFMLSAAVISMWISNTSTTLMLLPIAASVTLVIRETMSELGQKNLLNFETSMLLGLAYGATLGGMSTLVGTPPNAFMAGFMADTYNLEIDFARWMLVGVPLAAIMLPITWLVLTKFLYPVNFIATDHARRHINNLRSGLGPMSVAERRTAYIFLALVIGWLFRKPIISVTGLSGLTDPGIAMMAAVAAFIIPSGKKGEALMMWEDMKKLPWGVLILFGGGLALAAGMTSSGLTLWLGKQLAPLGNVHLGLLVVASVLLVIFLTEMTSNLATTATILPVMAAIAVETGQDPLAFVIPVTLAASCAFMLPVATPPNAIVFSSGHVSIPRMMRAGLVLNLIGVAVLSLIALKLVPIVFG
ncbi:MAG: anion transporter [Robiginitomaculum sp.]|nr:MAG: anion transporter [Robiginitomaculum sp.]